MAPSNMTAEEALERMWGKVVEELINLGDVFAMLSNITVESNNG